MEVPMAMGRPKAVLVLSAEQRAQLESMASSSSLPAGLVTRVRIVLLSAAGKMNQEIARQLGLTNATVGKWRQRFVELRRGEGFRSRRCGQDPDDALRVRFAFLLPLRARGFEQALLT